MFALRGFAWFSIATLVFLVGRGSAEMVLTEVEWQGEYGCQGTATQIRNTNLCKKAIDVYSATRSADEIRRIGTEIAGVEKKAGDAHTSIVELRRLMGETVGKEVAKTRPDTVAASAKDAAELVVKRMLDEGYVVLTKLQLDDVKSKAASVGCERAIAGLRKAGRLPGNVSVDCTKSP